MQVYNMETMLKLFVIISLAKISQAYIMSYSEPCDWDIYDCDYGYPYPIYYTWRFKCHFNQHCPQNFKCCHHHCFRHKICQPRRYGAPTIISQSQLSSKNDLLFIDHGEKPGKCNVLIGCDIVFPRDFIEKFRCAHDYACPVNYKCCYISCWNIKVCQPIIYEMSLNTSTSTTLSSTVILTTKPTILTVPTTLQSTIRETATVPVVLHIAKDQSSISFTSSTIRESTTPPTTETDHIIAETETTVTAVVSTAVETDRALVVSEVLNTAGIAANVTGKTAKSSIAKDESELSETTLKLSTRYHIITDGVITGNESITDNINVESSIDTTTDTVGLSVSTGQKDVNILSKYSTSTSSTSKGTTDISKEPSTALNEPSITEQSSVRDQVTSSTIQASPTVVTDKTSTKETQTNEVSTVPTTDGVTTAAPLNTSSESVQTILSTQSSPDVDNEVTKIDAKMSTTSGSNVTYPNVETSNANVPLAQGLIWLTEELSPETITVNYENDTYDDSFEIIGSGDDIDSTRDDDVRMDDEDF